MGVGVGVGDAGGAETVALLSAFGEPDVQPLSASPVATAPKPHAFVTARRETPPDEIPVFPALPVFPRKMMPSSPTLYAVPQTLQAPCVEDRLIRAAITVNTLTVCRRWHI